MGSEKTEKALQTLKKWRDDGVITEQKYATYSTKALDLWLERQSEGEGGDRGQAPDAAEGTSSGRGREVSGQGSEAQLVATAATLSALRRSEGVAAERSDSGPKASEGRHDDDDVGRRVMEVCRQPKAIDARKVKEMFRGVGTVTEAVVHNQDGSPKARATFRVTFADSSQAERAVKTMHGKQVEGIGNIGVKMLAPKKEVVSMAVDQRPERAAGEAGPSTSGGAKAAGTDGPGPSKRPRPEGEGDERPERAAGEAGPSTSGGAKAAGADGPGPSKRPRPEGEGDERPERAAGEAGPSASGGAKAAGADGPGPSKRPRLPKWNEGEEYQHMRSKCGLSFNRLATAISILGLESEDFDTADKMSQIETVMSCVGNVVEGSQEYKFLKKTLEATGIEKHNTGLFCLLVYNLLSVGEGGQGHNNIVQAYISKIKENVLVLKQIAPVQEGVVEVHAETDRAGEGSLSSTRIAAPVQEQGDVHAETDMAGEGTSSGTKKFTAGEVDELFWKEIGPFVESLENDSTNALAAFKEARKFDSKEGWRGILKKEDFFTLLTCYKFLTCGFVKEDLAPPSFFTHKDKTKLDKYKFEVYKKTYLGLDDKNESPARKKLQDLLGFWPEIWQDYTMPKTSQRPLHKVLAGSSSKNILMQKLRKQRTAAEVVRAWAPSVKGWMALWTEIFKAESSIIEEPQEPDPAETDLAGEGTSKGTKNFEDPDQLPTLAGACPSPEWNKYK